MLSGTSVKFSAGTNFGVDKPFATGDPTIGMAYSRKFPDANIAWGGTVEFGKTTLAATINFEAGTLTSAEAAPVHQVETLTPGGTVSTAGTASVVVTGAYIAGSPLTIEFAVPVSATGGSLAALIRAALNGSTAVTDQYAIGGTTTVILTDKKNRQNDGTLNVALADVTSAGITEGNSTNTTSGVGGVVITGGDGKDLQGKTLPTANRLDLVVLRNTGNSALELSGSELITDAVILAGGQEWAMSGACSALLDGSVTVSTYTTGEAKLEVLVYGKS